MNLSYRDEGTQLNTISQGNYKMADAERHMPWDYQCIMGILKTTFGGVLQTRVGLIQKWEIKSGGRS